MIECLYIIMYFLKKKDINIFIYIYILPVYILGMVIYKNSWVYKVKNEIIEHLKLQINYLQTDLSASLYIYIYFLSKGINLPSKMLGGGVF